MNYTISFIFLLSLFTSSCSCKKEIEKENKLKKDTQVTKAVPMPFIEKKNSSKIDSKTLPTIYKHKDKTFEKLQNIEIRLSVFDIEKVIQEFCVDNQKSPTVEQINKILNDENMQYHQPPNTDHKDVVQLDLRDITLESFNLSYDKEYFECKGSIEASIQKLKWKQNITIPQGITTQVELNMIDQAHSK